MAASGQNSIGVAALRMAVETTPVATAFLAIGGKTIWCNAALCQLFGRTEAQMKEVTLVDLSHPDDRDVNADLREQMRRGEIDSYQVEKRYRHADGSTIWARVHVSATRSADGDVMVIQFADTADQRRAQHAERMLARATETAVTGLIIFELDATMSHINSTMAQMVGARVDEMVGRSVLHLVHPEDRERVLAEVQPMLRGEACGCLLEHRAIHRDGSIVRIRSHLSPVRDETGTPVQIIAQVEDFTALHELHTALEATRQRFTALVEHSADVIALVNDAGSVICASPALYRLTGAQQAPIEWPHLLDLLHPDDVSRVERTWYELLEQPGTTRSFDTRLTSDSGAWRRFEVVATNRLDDKGVGGVVINLRDVSERAAAYEAMQWQAFHDPLTGLANRALLFDRMQQLLLRSRGDSTAVALLYLDLDGFKPINDLHGHQAGDFVLVEIADRIRTAVRHLDTAARIGGDEFVVLVEHQVSAERAVALAQRVLDAIDEPIRLPSGAFVHISSSIGVAYATGGEPDSLVQRADAALYRAKRTGRGTIVVDDAPDTALTTRLRAGGISRLR